jgi:hypothetical protein
MGISWGFTRLFWLVVWNIFYFSIYWECHHPNWLIIFRGVETTNQFFMELLIDLTAINWRYWLMMMNGLNHRKMEVYPVVMTNSLLMMVK